ncbi:MAG: hypothetical protein J1F35_02240 [Erysipelotrichales bacterium]|nr:hypothetical protein [Erysipelotrichales bacterium]
MKKYSFRLFITTFIILLFAVFAVSLTTNISKSINTIVNSANAVSSCNPGTGQTMYVNTSGVNVRSDASGSGSTLTTLNKCTQVTAYCTQGSYTRVSKSSNKFIYTSYLQSSVPSGCSGSAITTTTNAPTFSTISFTKSTTPMYRNEDYYMVLTLNTANIASDELDSKLSVTIKNGSKDATSQFNITKSFSSYDYANDTNKVQITISKNNSTTSGNFTIYLNGTSSQPFTVEKDKFNFTATQYSGSPTSENNDGEWVFRLSNLTPSTGISMNDFDYVIKSNNADYTSRFTFEVSGNSLIVKNKKRVIEYSEATGDYDDLVSDYTPAGSYTLTLTLKSSAQEKYSDYLVPDYSKTASGTILVTKKVGSIIETQFTNDDKKNGINQYIRYKLETKTSDWDIEVIGAKNIDGILTYILYDKLTEKTEEYTELEMQEVLPNLYEYVSSFNECFNNPPSITSANKRIILIDPNNANSGYRTAYATGNICVYKYNASAVAVEEKFTYVDKSGVVSEVNGTDFSVSYSSAYLEITDESSKYISDSETGYLLYTDNGKNSKITKELNETAGQYPFASSGGEITVKLTFNGYLKSEINNFSAILEKKEIGGTKYNVIDKYYNDISHSTDPNLALNVYRPSTSSPYIYITFKYDGNDSHNYATDYRIRYGFSDDELDIYSYDFTLEDGIFDYIIYSEAPYGEYDLCDTVDDKTVCVKPYANHKQNYYLGFYQYKSGQELEKITSKLDSIVPKIYVKKADLDTQGNVIFYDEVEYFVKITNYNGNDVTYQLSDDEGLTWKESKTTTKSEFEKDYTDAAAMLEKYTFDSDGMIQNDNFNIHVQKIIDGDDEHPNGRIVYKNGNATTDTTVDMTNAWKTANADIYSYIMTKFVFDAEGNYILGAVKGSRKENEEFYSEATVQKYDVTDDFIVAVNYPDNGSLELDPKRALIVLPKTEVTPGIYYVYISYNGLGGAGYLYNYSDPDDPKDENAPINKVLNPELWQQNIHETTIEYSDPVYSVTVDTPVITNSRDNIKTAYTNAESYISMNFTLNYIYDTSKLRYEIKKDDQIVNDYFSVYYHPVIPTTITQENYKKNVLNLSTMTLTTKVGITQEGKYEIVFYYDNKPVGSKEFEIAGNYYNMNFIELMDEDKTYISNERKNVDFKINTSAMDNPENIELSLIYNNGIDAPKSYPYDRKKGKFTDNSGVTLFTVATSTSGENEENSNVIYHINMMNYDNTKLTMPPAGTYTLKATYKEEDGETIEISIDFYVVEVEKNIEVRGTTAKATEDEFSFTMTLRAQNISYESLTSNTTQYLISYYDVGNEGMSDPYVPASGIYAESTNKMFDIEVEWNEDTANENIYEGTMKVNIDINKIDDIYAIYDSTNDMPYTFLLEITVDYEDYPIEVPNLRNLFDWNIIDYSITSQFVDKDSNSYTVDDNIFYSNLKDTTIVVYLDTVHENLPNFKITQSCATISSCSPSTAIDFNENNSRFELSKESTYNKLVLKVKDDLSEDLRLEKGKYQLLLYYSDNDFDLVDFTVKSEFALIEFGEETIETKLTNGFSPNLFSNKDSVITIPTTVLGIDYENVTIDITDPNQETSYKHYFKIDEDKFKYEHMIEITYKSTEDIPPGKYMIIAYKEVDGEIVSDKLIIEFSDTYFNLEVTGVTYDPNPAVPNYENGGKINLHIATEELLSPSDSNGNRLIRNEIIKGIKVTDAFGEDFTDKFKIETGEIESTNNFIAVLAYDQESEITPGTYTVTITYNKNQTIVSAKTEIRFENSETRLKITDVSYVSSTNDGLVHTNVNGSFVINFESNQLIDTEQLYVEVLNREGNNVDNFESINKNTDNVTLVYNTDNKINPGIYEVTLTYEDPVTNNEIVDSVEIMMSGEYKDIKIDNMTPSKKPIIAEEENQFYTFLLDRDNISDEELEEMEVRILDEYGNIVYSNIKSGNYLFDVEIVENEVIEETQPTMFKINIPSYKVRVGTYKVQLLLSDGYMSYNISNELDFTVDETLYKITLRDSSNIVTKERINNSDNIYDYIGVNGVFDFTSNSPIADEYSIKIFNEGLLIKEIKANASLINGYSEIIFDADEISYGDVEFALCIRGLPYLSITKEVLEYIKITELIVFDLDEYDITEETEIILDQGEKWTFDFLIKPENATNQNPIFTAKDENIATFDGFTVTALSNGTTEVTVYTKEISQKFKLTVSDYLNSNTYEINNEDKTIFVNSMTSKTLTKDEFMSKLSNVSKNYKILNLSDNDVTSTTKVIGTKYKFVNGNIAYTIIVKGDLNGSGTIDFTDVATLYQIFSVPVTPDKYVLKAGQILGNQNIGFTDVARLYQFFDNIINRI